jgi:Flp pilus assembly protein TadD
MFEQAVSLAPRDHRYRRNLGDAYAIAGRLADARAAWTQAATMIEGDTASAAASADLYATAALYRAKLRETAATRRWLADAERLLRPDDAGAQLKIAQAQELIGDREAALTTLTRAVGAGLARAEIDQSAELAQLRQDRRYAHLASPLATAHAAVAP